MVFNQIDRAPQGTADPLIARYGGVAISARACTGLQELVTAADALLWGEAKISIDSAPNWDHAPTFTVKRV